MKATSLSLPAATVALLTAVLFAVTTVAQAPEGAPAAGGPMPPPPPHHHPMPTNLKVLPKDFNGDQVDKVMDAWSDALGVRCNTCHTADPNNIGPNGRPRLKYADDSKKEKAAARQMFTMTEEINKDYVSKIDSSGAPVTCGTCHRGHLGPEPFIAPPENHGPPPPPPTGAGPAPAPAK